MKEDGSILFADREGKEAFRLWAEGLTYAGDFMDNGLAFYVTEGPVKSMTGYPYAYLAGVYNTQGEILTPPCHIVNFEDRGVCWSEGVFPVEYAETRGMGYIDESGLIEYPLGLDYDRAEPFRGGLAPVRFYSDYLEKEKILPGLKEADPSSAGLYTAQAQEYFFIWNGEKPYYAAPEDFLRLFDDSLVRETGIVITCPYAIDGLEDAEIVLYYDAYDLSDVSEDVIVIRLD